MSQHLNVELEYYEQTMIGKLLVYNTSYHTENKTLNYLLQPVLLPILTNEYDSTWIHYVAIFNANYDSYGSNLN